MKISDELWALSFLRMALDVTAMPIPWVILNSRFWSIRILEFKGDHRVTSDKKIRIIKD